MRLKAVIPGRTRTGLAVMAVALSAALCAPALRAAPQSTRAVGIPMPFESETARLLTSACMAGTERIYGADPWWSGPADSKADAAENAVRAVIAAIKSQDREALLRASDPSSVADRAQFDRQATAFFSQMQSTRIDSVPLAYDMGGLVVFYVKFHLEGGMPYASLSFTRSSQGTVAFLPVRSSQTALRLIDFWFATSVKSSPEGRPTFCPDDTMKRATQSVTLPPGIKLLLTGGRVDGKGAVAAVAGKARTAVTRIATAAKAGNAGEVGNHMTAAGSQRLQQWNATATPAERAQYFDALKGMKPVFVFDASPLVVTYVSTPQGMQALYFTPGAKGDLLWTNSSHITSADEIFKKGSLLAAASTDPPFQNLAVR